MQKLSIIGLMSGSSLDGVDMAWCDFTFNTEAENPVHDWRLRAGITQPYPLEWRDRLQRATALSGLELWQLHTDLGHYYGQKLKTFIEDLGRAPDLVASHGHTVFHFPDKRMTTQIGDGAAIAAHLALPVVDQFRNLDVALGGQGAPLAPLADKYLFGSYQACLNLGGIANLSVKTPSSYYAFDVSGANQVLDNLMAEIGKPFDGEGRLAQSGQLLPNLLTEANALPFLHADYPKSLGNDWVQNELLPIFQRPDYRLADRLHTLCVHLAQQIAWHLQRVFTQEGFTPDGDAQLLVTGGGGFNDFLCRLIAEAIAPLKLAKADPELISYKEAVLMALAGGLRWLHLPNVLPSVTGARRSAVGGAIHWGGVRNDEGDL